MLSKKDYGQNNCSDTREVLIKLYFPIILVCEIKIYCCLPKKKLADSKYNIKSQNVNRLIYKRTQH